MTGTRKRDRKELPCRICTKRQFEPDPKRRRLSRELEDPNDRPNIHSTVFTTGFGETGQLGLGPEIQETREHLPVQMIPSDVVYVVCGGMHTVCVRSNGEVWSFGLNDQGTLGRTTEEEEGCFTPERVLLALPVNHVSAGDSHTVAVTEEGRTFIWGTFRDSNGHTGLISGGPAESIRAVEIMPRIPVHSVRSGNDHVLCLAVTGVVYSFGVCEVGQLGRVPRPSPKDTVKRTLELEPQPVTVSYRNPRISDIWTGQYTSYAKDEHDCIYAWGLNNFYQLGLGVGYADNEFFPQKWSGLNAELVWLEIAGGLHHTLALDCLGRVFAVGRAESGQLGMGRGVGCGGGGGGGGGVRGELGLVSRLSEIFCTSIACGTNVSFAISRNGIAYGWGTGDTGQLGLGESENDVFVPKPLLGTLQTRSVLMVSAGGQHSVVLADQPATLLHCDNNSHITS